MTSSGRSLWRGVVGAGLSILGLGCGLGLIASLGGGLAWWLEVFTHWEPCMAGGLVVLLPWLIWRRRWIWVAMAGVLVVKAGFVLAPWLLPADTGALITAEGDRTITVVTLNLQVDLGDHRELVAWVLAQEPDLVAVQEITALNAPDLRDLLMGALRHGHVVVATPTWALGILSRHPLVDVNDGQDCGLRIAARVEDPSGAFEFVAVHLEPPVLPRLAHSNRRALAALAEHIERTSGPAIVAGDFNLAPWAPSFRAFVERSGLSDPRRGRGLLPTWSPPGIPASLLPIDHVLATSGWRVARIRRGPRCGSDHRPLAVVLVREP